MCPIKFVPITLSMGLKWAWYVKNVTFSRKRDHSLPSVGLKTKVMVHFVSHKHCPFRTTIKEALLGHKCPITLCHHHRVYCIGSSKKNHARQAALIIEAVDSSISLIGPSSLNSSLGLASCLGYHVTFSFLKDK